MDMGKGRIDEGDNKMRHCLVLFSVRILLMLSVRYAALPSIWWILRDQRGNVMPIQLVPDSRLPNKLIS